MPKFQGGFCVHRIKDILDGNALGLVLRDHLLKRGKDGLQFIWKSIARGDADRAGIDVAKPSATAIDHAVARNLTAAIDAEYDHAPLAAAPDRRAMSLLDEFGVGFGRRWCGCASKKSGIGVLVEDLFQRGSQQRNEISQPLHELTPNASA